MIMPLPVRLKDPEKIKRVRPLFLFDNYYMISPSLVGLAIIAKEVIVKLGNNSYYDWLDYKVQLLAGGTVIAEDDTYDAGDAALVGQPLEIRLLAASVDGLEVDTDFDDVVLTADPPFPAPAGVQTVTLTLEVTDDVGSLSDTMMIDVYGDACKAAIGAGLDPIELTDHDGNCITGFEYLVKLVAVWLDDYSLTEPFVKPVIPPVIF